MKRLIVSTLAAGALALAPCVAEAQIGFGLNGGVSLPMGDYGGDSGEDAGAAETGFSVFAELGLSLPLFPVGATLTAGVTSHGADDTLAEALGFAEAGRYYAVPVLVGPRFDLSPVPTLDVYIDGQLGAAMFRGPSVELTDGGEVEADWETGFAWSVGAGVDLPVFFGVGARYVSLGDVTVEYTDDSGTTFSREQPVSWVDVFVSIGM